MISEPAKIKEYYQALTDRNSQYLGIFYVAVKTTNIFCIATCRARKPKLENVVFYATSKEAIQHGFRPCKVCRPMENVSEPPDEVKDLMDLVATHPGKKISDAELRQLGYSPGKIRRWFKTHHDMTFQTYQRMTRINAAYENLKNGNRVTASAFGSGYESLSGFGYTFKNVFDISPGHADQVNVIYLHRFTTPLGPMYAGATAKGICLLEFTDRRMLESEFKDLTKRLKAKIIVGKNDHSRQAQQQVQEYFEGSRTQFDVVLDTPGSEFQQRVWDELKKVPFGTTRTYKQQANVIGQPSAIRAVASANGHNRVSIIIPCHRIIGSDGHLTGYGGGLARKKWLLEHEKEVVGKDHSE